MSEDEEVAWQMLDVARTLYQEALEAAKEEEEGESASSSSSSSALVASLRKELARVVSRIGDLNMATCRFGDALMEYEQVLKLREAERGNANGSDGSNGSGSASGSDAPLDVGRVCRLADTNMQVAFAYLEHIASTISEDGDEGAAVEVATVAGGTLVVCEAAETRNQMHAYRNRAQVRSFVRSFVHSFVPYSVS